MYYGLPLNKDCQCERQQYQHRYQVSKFKVNNKLANKAQNLRNGHQRQKQRYWIDF
jgi:hypothetical protein